MYLTTDAIEHLRQTKIQFNKIQFYPGRGKNTRVKANHACI